MLKKVSVSVLTAVMLLGGIGAGAAFEPDIDYAQEANPAIFTPSLTREFYNSARNAYLHSAEMAAGYDHDTVTLDRSITIPLPAGMVVNEDMRGVCNRIGGVTYRFNITEKSTPLCTPTRAWTPTLKSRTSAQSLKRHSR